MNAKGANKIKNPVVWLSPITGWMLIFYLTPLVFIIVTSFLSMENFRISNEWTLRNYTQIFREKMYYDAFLASLWLSVKSVGITILIAYPLAYTLAFIVPERWRIVLLISIIAPFWTNYLIRAYSWHIVLSNNGVINYALISLGIIKESLKILYTPIATTIGLVHYLLAIMILNIYVTLENIDKRLFEAAKDLGSNGLNTFFRITLPLSSGGVVTGGIFIFILAFSDYISPSTLGGQSQRVFSQLIVDSIQWNINWPLACAFAVIMIATLLIIVSILSRWLNIGNRTEGGTK